MRYKWNLKETAPEQAAEAARLAKEAGVHPVLGKLLLHRRLLLQTSAHRTARSVSDGRYAGGRGPTEPRHAAK